MALSITVSSSDWIDLRTRGYTEGMYLLNAVGAAIEYSTAATPVPGTTLVGSSAVLISGTYLWVRGSGDCELYTASEWVAANVKTVPVMATTTSSVGVVLPVSDAGRLIVPSPLRQISIGRQFAKKAPIVIWGGESMTLSQVTALQGSPTMTIETYNGKKCLKVVTAAGVVTDIQFSGMTGKSFDGEIYLAMEGGLHTGAQSMAFYSTPDAAYTTNYAFGSFGNFQPIGINDFRDAGGIWTARIGRSQQAITGSITYPFIVGTSKLRITPKTGEVATLRIFLAGFAPVQSKARFCVISDDGDASWLTVGAMECGKRGIPSTLSLIASEIGTSYTGTLEQMRAYVHQFGNAIVAHGPNIGGVAGNIITNYPSNIPGRIADMNISRDSIFANGMDVPGADLCYVFPQGAYQDAALNPSTLDAMLAAGFTTGRVSTNHVATAYFNWDSLARYNRLTLPYCAPSGSTNAGTNAANVSAVRTSITNAISQASDLSVTFHVIVPDSTPDAAMKSTSCRYTDFVNILNDMQAAVAAGTAEFVTLPQIALSGMSSPWATL